MLGGSDYVGRTLLSDAFDFDFRGGQSWIAWWKLIHAS
jgi:hypothetical protein